GEDPSLVVTEDLVRGACALFGAALHEALEIDRAMFAGEMALAVREWLPSHLVSAEACVLPDLPVGVRPEQERVAGREIERGPTGPQPRDPGEDSFELHQEGPGIGPDDRRVIGVAGERRPDVAAGVVDENPWRPTLASGHLPGVLVPIIREGVAGANSPGTGAFPQPAAELQLKLAVRTVTQLLDGRLLQRVEAGRAVLVVARQDGAQH